ncbi:hypothetical protein NIES2101_10450 [Calothrix sp. HK-06]|nr:hypothetical protein NIES2101_10450 [Calothrix sp. HK-06]
MPFIYVKDVVTFTLKKKATVIIGSVNRTYNYAVSKNIAAKAPIWYYWFESTGSTIEWFCLNAGTKYY